MIMEIITDWKHWLGWVISAGIIYVTFYLIMTKYPTFNKIYAFIALIVIIAVVDMMKHEFDLQ